MLQNLDKDIRIIYRPHPWLRDIEIASKILNLKSENIKIDKKYDIFYDENNTKGN